MGIRTATIIVLLALCCAGASAQVVPSKFTNKRVTTDTLLAGVIKSTVIGATVRHYLRADGTLGLFISEQGTFGANDTILITGIPTGKTWAYGWAVQDKPPTNLVPGFRVSNDTLYVSSSTLGVTGVVLFLTLTEQN